MMRIKQERLQAAERREMWESVSWSQESWAVGEWCGQVLSKPVRVR